MSKGTQASWAQRRVSRAKARVSGPYGKSLLQGLLSALYPPKMVFEGLYDQLAYTKGSLTGRIPRMDTLQYKELPSGVPTKGTKEGTTFRLTEVDYSGLELHILASLTEDEKEMSEQVEKMLKVKSNQIQDALWLAAMYGFPASPATLYQLPYRKGNVVEVTRKDEPEKDQTRYGIRGKRPGFFIVDDMT